MNMNVRQCKTCKRLYELSFDNFKMTNDKTGKGFLRHECRNCWNERQKTNYHKRTKQSPEYWEAHKQKCRKNHLLKKYNLTLEQVEAMHKKGCLICGSFERLAIDHCHISGKVRGCLCNDCNTALGMAKDNPVILKRMAKYLLDNR